MSEIVDQWIWNYQHAESVKVAIEQYYEKQLAEASKRIAELEALLQECRNQKQDAS